MLWILATVALALMCIALFMMLVCVSQAFCAMEIRAEKAEQALAVEKIRPVWTNSSVLMSSEDMLEALQGIDEAETVRRMRES